MRRVRRILHPTDFSAASRPAFAQALEMAKARQAELLLLHVIDTAIPMGAEGYAWQHAYREITAPARASSQKALERLLARAKRLRVRARSLVREGRAHDQIIRVAKATRADLIVMGTHGRTGLRRLALGSVAGRVIALAPCPVLTVRAK